MDRTAAKKRRDRKKATDLRRRGEVATQPRLGSPKLSRIERNKLRAGCLRRIEPGDTVRMLAARLGQSEACVREALSHDIRCVDEVLDGGKCVEIAKMRPEWSPSFVDLARRDIFARRNWLTTQRLLRQGNSYDLQGQPSARSSTSKPWTDFNRGQTKRRATARQAKTRNYELQMAQLRSLHEIENEALLAQLSLDEGGDESSFTELIKLCEDIEL